MLTIYENIPTDELINLAYAKHDQLVIELAKRLEAMQDLDNEVADAKNAFANGKAEGYRDGWADGIRDSK